MKIEICQNESETQVEKFEVPTIISTDYSNIPSVPPSIIQKASISSSQSSSTVILDHIFISEKASNI